MWRRMMALAALVVQSSGQTMKVVVTGRTDGGLSGRDVIDTVGDEASADIVLVQATSDSNHCTGKETCLLVTSVDTGRTVIVFFLQMGVGLATIHVLPLMVWA
eukprot:gene3382-27856_t